MQSFVIRNRLSTWLIVASIVMTSTMMHPSFAALFVIGVNALILVLARKIAMLEGRGHG